MASGPLEIPLVLPGFDAQALPRIGRRQGLVDALRAAIEAGLLQPTQSLPASRVLASQVRLSRGTVLEAYDQLVGEGYLETTARTGTRVATDVRATAAPAVELDRTAPEPAGAPAGIDLRPGIPDSSQIDSSAWRAAWHHAASHLSAYNPPTAGLLELQEAIADHLRRFRGLHRRPDDVIVTSGTDEAVELVVAAEHARRAHQPTIAIEEPGYTTVRRRLQRLGVPTVPLPVDPTRALWALDQLHEERPNLVVVSPSHQYPLGVAMGLPARQQLLDIASTHDMTVIEDDYDSEYRYDHAPRPALAALAPPGLVAHIGSFSKTLSPTLRTAYLIVQQGTPLRAALDSVLADRSPSVSGVTQAALASFIARGDLARHIARTRRRYARRRTDVLRALQPLPAGYELLGAGGGLHVVLRFPDHMTAEREDRLVEQLARAGVLVTSLGYYYAAPAAPNRLHGVVFGYANAADHQLQQALHRISAAIKGAGSTEAADPGRALLHE